MEYNNTVRDILGDATSPGNELPAEVVGNGFGNNAASLSTSLLHVERYARIAEKVAARVTSDARLFEGLHPCVKGLVAASETACAGEVASALAEKAFRKPKAELAPRVTELVDLYRNLRKSAPFRESIAGVVEAVLQSADFLYRPETGRPAGPPPAGAMASGLPDRRPLTGAEIAVRLSYLFWGTAPDETLRAAAADGRLSTKEGVREQAERLLADARARAMVRYFFDNYLPIGGLGGTVRDPALFPHFSSATGGLMREETHRFLESVFFEGPGDWPTALTAPYTFVNKELAEFYGLPTAGLGTAFTKVPLDPSKRAGVLTQASVMTGTTHSSHTNPVKRGAYVLHRMLCREIPFPTGALAELIVPPKANVAPTGRERYSQHSSNPQCAACHRQLDPVGFSFENYDAVRLHRTMENGAPIDASGGLPGRQRVNDAVGLVKDLAADPATMACFAENWANFAYGIKLEHSDPCLRAQVVQEFGAAGFRLKEYLVRLALTDYFLSVPMSQGAAQ